MTYIKSASIAALVLIVAGIVMATVVMPYLLEGRTFATATEWCGPPQPGRDCD